MTAAPIILKGVQAVDGTAHDIRVSRGVVSAIESVATPAPGDFIVDCRGLTMLPGLHDHHIHVLATASARGSVLCGPPDVMTFEQLGRVLSGAVPSAGWIRGINYFESGAGLLDRDVIDSLRSDVPVRIAHRSGALWVLNSAAVDALRVEESRGPGIERDLRGRCTGRLWRMDSWLAERLGSSAPDLGPVAHDLLSYGVTGLTDATPRQTPETARLVREGMDPLRVLLLGLDVDADEVPVKIVLADHDLCSLEELAAAISGARPRPVAVHSVTRSSLLLILVALEEVGSVPGDRIEHAAVTPPEARVMARQLGVAVVTQPSLVTRRGDSYLDEVDSDDLEFLWPFGSLRRAGITVACSSDAPYGDLDPWLSISAATSRLSPSGRPVSPHERVDAATALAGYLSSPTSLGTERNLEVGSAADLVLLDGSIEDILHDPSSSRVRFTVVDGRIAYDAENPR